MPEIFLSYSQKDSGPTKNVVTHLEAAGFDVWIDRENISGGTLWREGIVKAITECKVFIIIISPDSVASQNVRKELDLADRKNKPVLPLVLRITEIPDSLQFALAGVQWIDFTKFERGVKHLLSVLDRQQRGELLGEFTGSRALVEGREKILTQSEREMRSRVYSSFARDLWDNPPAIQFRLRQMYSLSHLRSMGVTVSQLKTALKHLQYYSDEVTDEFEPKLASALIHFQLDNELDPDGIAGTLTYQRIVEQLSQ